MDDNVLFNMPFDELLSLYNKKNALIKEGNISELIILKKAYPGIFIEKNVYEIAALIANIKQIQNMPWFKVASIEEKKKKLISPDYDKWYAGMLDAKLSGFEKLSFRNYDVVSRELVKDAFATSLAVCKENLIDPNIVMVFPFVGFLISEILSYFPKDRYQRLLEGAFFKLNGNKKIDQASFDVHAAKKWQQTIPNFTTVASKIKIQLNIMVRKLTDKFDKRRDYYADALFFCLIETAEFIHLLAPHIGCLQGENIDDAINKVKGNVE